MTKDVCNSAIIYIVTKLNAGVWVRFQNFLLLLQPFTRETTSVTRCLLAEHGPVNRIDF